MASGIITEKSAHTRSCRQWTKDALAVLQDEAANAPDTPMHRLALPAHPGVRLYVKDESAHGTGSLKHRLARSLFIHALVNGWIEKGTPVIEASSGSTAVSEAHFARLLGLPFIAVVPRTTSPEKISLIEVEGGACHFVDAPGHMYSEAERLAAEHHGHYMDQFKYAERATDWRGNNNIAESIYHQLDGLGERDPDWIVVGAGTGGTSATIGRYLRYHGKATCLAVVDPENSAFTEGWESHNLAHTTGMASRIEGIGRPRVEPSFLPGVVDAMVRVPDAASVAAMRHLRSRTGLAAGPSTGTNLWGVRELIERAHAEGRDGDLVLVTLLCDGAERYENTYYDDPWCAERGVDPRAHQGTLEDFDLERVQAL